MTRKSVFAASTVFVVVFLASVASADVVSWSCAADGDGVITCQPTWSESAGVYTLAIDGVQTRVAGQPADGLAGHILGDIITDTELDPTVKIANSIDNDTDFTWTDYHINISMTKTFAISNAAVSAITNPPITIPGDWSAYITQPVLDGGLYVGHVDYYAGTGVDIGGTLDFGYTLSFLGSVSYTQEMIPSPEPATMGLLTLGGAGLLVRRRR